MATNIDKSLKGEELIRSLDLFHRAEKFSGNMSYEENLHACENDIIELYKERVHERRTIAAEETKKYRSIINRLTLGAVETEIQNTLTSMITDIDNYTEQARNKIIQAKRKVINALSNVRIVKSSNGIAQFDSPPYETNIAKSIFYFLLIIFAEAVINVTVYVQSVGVLDALTYGILIAVVNIMGGAFMGFGSRYYTRANTWKKRGSRASNYSNELIVSSLIMLLGAVMVFIMAMAAGHARDIFSNLDIGGVTTAREALERFNAPSRIMSVVFEKWLKFDTIHSYGLFALTISAASFAIYKCRTMFSPFVGYRTAHMNLLSCEKLLESSVTASSNKLKSICDDGLEKLNEHMEKCSADFDAVSNARESVKILIERFLRLKEADYDAAHSALSSYRNKYNELKERDYFPSSLIEDAFSDENDDLADMLDQFDKNLSSQMGNVEAAFSKIQGDHRDASKKVIAHKDKMLKILNSVAKAQHSEIDKFEENIKKMDGQQDLTLDATIEDGN